MDIENHVRSIEYNDCVGIVVHVVKKLVDTFHGTFL